MLAGVVLKLNVTYLTENNLKKIKVGLPYPVCPYMSGFVPTQMTMYETKLTQLSYSVRS